ncbi:glycosyltransferase family 4 protein [Bradyrhizobium canariense]|uniref:glycosyltransferase family 4 protein n=1 Tax=Bradyrhizobium canariense TaxID=255045 RepID=UPI001C67ADF2|nr:glycosyltransferase family 4 protein [Bradyrhizobium canariense]MBW5438030.1 glycosyltransferase family 4 protein [Bradyrhizobium canariense]
MPEHKAEPRARTVSFLLPGSGNAPVGGFKVAYEYANGLARRGWKVRVVHPHILTMEEIEELRTDLVGRGRRWLGYQRRRITGKYRPDRWFEIGPGVELICSQTPHPSCMPASDVWVATYWYTAKWVATYPGARAYLIQHLETWSAAEADVIATWKLPLQKVVISRWLEEVAQSLGESAQYIPNGLNFRTFGLDVAPEERDPNTVAMLYHMSDWKGSSDGLAALRKVKQKVPELKAIIFGIFPPPAGLPNWVEYHHNPAQAELRGIYNRAAIFVAPSWTEGWPLPPAEALQCGSALAATDIGGHHEYARDRETALLSSPKDPDALAANIVEMVQSRELRLRLARQGHSHIQQFTWDRAVMSFESVLEDALSKRATNAGRERR